MRQEKKSAGWFGTPRGPTHTGSSLGTNPDRAPFGRFGGAGAPNVGGPERSAVVMLRGLGSALVTFHFFQVRLRIRS